LITIGAYAKGSDPRVDEAIQHWPAILKFLQQDSNAQISFGQSVAALQMLFPPAMGAAATAVRREGVQ
jgi:flagellum-specific ATP synthase